MKKPKDAFKAIPAVGEVWSSACQFSLRDDGVSLRPGLRRNEDGEYVEAECDGYELRTVVAVIEIPGHQRRIAYTRKFAPNGHASFGKKTLNFTAISSFNRWRRGTTRKHMQPAKMVEPGTVEKALAILKGKASEVLEAKAA